jgi:hypothetical protein
VISFVPATCDGIYNYNIRLAEEHRKSISRNEIYDCTCFYNKPDYYKPCRFYKRHLKVMTDHLFSYHGIPERHICKTDITKSHCKIDLLQYALTGTRVLLPSPMLWNHKQSKLLGIQKENTAKRFNPARRQMVTPTRMSKWTKCLKRN